MLQILIAIIMVQFNLLFYCNGIDVTTVPDAASEAKIEYYEDLIETERNKAYHDYQLPTSSESFRPRHPKAAQEFGTFDFVVIGSGAAGAVLGGRLSEIRKWNILVLEAGGNENVYSNIPGEYMYLQGLRFNWNYNTTPQAGACLGMVNNRCATPKGRVLGGSTAMNGLVYCRGNKADYNEWTGLGITGWSYEDVLPYFVKSENSQIDADPGYHGKGGPWNVEYHRPVSPQLQSLIQASQNVYENFTGRDYNGREQLGMFVSQLNNIRGMRDSTARAFLQPVKSRRNLKIAMDSYVTKVLINPITKVAFGVEFARNRKLYVAKVKKEIIISGGAINSPQILMLSGVGPREHLEKMGIPVIQDLAVGRELRDHATFYGLYVRTNLTQPNLNLRESIKQYLNGYGPLSIATNTQGVGFYQTNSSDDTGRPDVEFEIIPSFSGNPFAQRVWKIREDVYKELESYLNPETDINIFLLLLHTKSYGYLKLQSRNPYEYPVINPRYLSDPRDITTMYQGLLILEKLLQTEPMRKINASIVQPEYSKCSAFETGSQEYWYCSFRLLTAPSHHTTSSCKMGADPKAGAIVDDKLRVYGVANLRVADAGVIPTTISGHTSAPSVMVGEKASDIIKLDHGEQIDPITNTITN